MIQQFSFILLAILLCCGREDTKAQSTGNYADTLINIGTITVSNPFFIRDVRNYIASTSPHKVDSSSLSNWYNNYLDKLFLTNCAKDSGFLKRADVEEAAIGFENYVLIQKGSPFYTANISSKVIVSPHAVEDAYKKMSTITNFSFIRFSDNETYLNALKGRKPSDAVFKEYKSANNDSIKYGQSELIWPSLEFWHLQYQIASLKVGEISGSVNARNDEFSDAIYLIRVDSIRQIASKPFNLEKQRLEMTLNKIKEDSLYDRYEKTILHKAKIQFNKNNLNDSLIQRFINHCTNPNDQYFKPYLKVELMKYSLNGIQVIVKVIDFLKYYRNLPVRLNLRTRGEINNFLYYFVLSSYMVRDASMANFDKEVRYLALKKDLRNKFALQKFEDELFNKVRVSNKECLDFYHNHLQDYNSNTRTKVTFLSFNSENDAISVKMILGNIDSTLFEEKVKNKTLSPNIVSIYSNEVISHSDSLKYPAGIITQVFEAKNGSFCGPFKLNNQTVLIYKKNACGNRLKTFKESEEQIYSSLREQKYTEVKNSLLKQAHEKYPLHRVPTFNWVKNVVQ
jgi:hypothetical protein